MCKGITSNKLKIFKKIIRYIRNNKRDKELHALLNLNNNILNNNLNNILAKKQLIMKRVERTFAVTECKKYCKKRCI